MAALFNIEVFRVDTFMCASSLKKQTPTAQCRRLLYSKLVPLEQMKQIKGLVKICERGFGQKSVRLNEYFGQHEGGIKKEDLSALALNSG